MINKNPQIIYHLRKAFYNLSKHIYIDPEDVDEQNPKISFAIDLCFYILASQYFKKSKIKFGGEEKDLRVSGLLIRDSRFGKGQLIKLVEGVGKNLNLRIERTSYLEQASLIGTIDSEVKKYNILKGLTSSSANYRNPVILGDLANVDILIIPEAKKLLKGNNEKETEFVLSTLQEALDYPGIISKKLKYIERICYESSVSILGTTYFITEISKLLGEQGFFQRILIDKKTYTIKQVEYLRHKIIQLFRKKESNINFDLECKRFAELIKTFDNSQKILQFTDNAVSLLEEANKTYFKKISKASGGNLKVLESFSQTIIDMCTKIAGINACFRNDTEIEDFDLSPVITLFGEFTNTLLDELIIESKQHSYEEVIKQKFLFYFKEFFVEKQRQPEKTEFINFCKNKSEIGYNKVYNVINFMIKENYFRVEFEKEKNTMVLFRVEDI